MLHVSHDSLLCPLWKITPITAVVQPLGYAAWEPRAVPLFSSRSVPACWAEVGHSTLQAVTQTRHVLLHQGLLFAKQGWRGFPLLSALGFVFQWPWLRSLKLSCLRPGTESWDGMLEAREQTLCCKGCTQLQAQQANKSFACLAARTIW